MDIRLNGSGKFPAVDPANAPAPPPEEIVGCADRKRRRLVAPCAFRGDCILKHADGRSAALEFLKRHE